MRAAYVDSSCLVALAFGEPEGKRVPSLLRRFGVRVASNLLEAELRAALAREQVPEDPALFGQLDWVLPDRALTPEIDRILEVAYVRGADLWHLACALFVRTQLPGLAFVTLDRRQRDIAGALGLDTP